MTSLPRRKLVLAAPARRREVTDDFLAAIG
jgi:hypothetical protein